jgi:uncharacterized protein YqjF (DUF2071 family)
MWKLGRDLRRIADQIEHRPWPKPSTPWVMHQRWLDLLFAHWPIPVEEMRARVPQQLELDTFDGQAWVGVVPFRMSHVRPRGITPVPWLSAFPELNVRTYVKARDGRDPRPGVFFFSLDAANALAVAIARSWFKLPYFRAQMSLRQARNAIHYRSRRTHTGAPPAEFVARYAPNGEPYQAQAGTLERWLTERYSLYTVDRGGRVFRGEIHHEIWPLHPAQAEIETNTMAEAAGLRLPNTPPLLHFAHRLDVLIWPLQFVPPGEENA